WMNRLSPSMMEATEITEVTPITMPRMVRPERTLWLRSVSMATSRFSMASCRVMTAADEYGWTLVSSFAPQCDYGVQTGCPRCRIDSEKQADYRTKHQPEHRYPGLHRSGE